MVDVVTITQRLIDRLILRTAVTELAKVCFGLSLLLACALPSAAQEQPIRVGWLEAPPLLVSAADGRPSGFGGDLIKRLAALEDLDLEYVRVNDAGELIRALTNGDIDLISVIAPVPALVDEVVFSAPVMEFSTRLHVRVEAAATVDAATLAGAAIGVVPEVAGSAPSPLLGRNRIVEATTVNELIFDLLVGKSDGFVLGEALAFERARRAAVDHRIVAVGEPLQTFSRAIAMNPALVDLHAKVARGIAALDASGELLALRHRWIGRLGEVVPATLVVGVIDFPPYQIADDGTFSGFGVEVLRGIAELADVDLRFVEYGGPSPLIDALANGEIDLIAGLGVLADRRNFFDFSTPFELDTVSLFVRNDAHGTVDDLADLAGARVGVHQINAGRRVVEAADGLDVVVIDGPWRQLITMLRDGEVDAVVYSTEPFSLALSRANLASEIVLVGEPLLTVERAIALRKGLGPLRERLNVLTPSYLVSEDFAQLRDEWFGQSVFWTRARMRWLFIGFGGLMLSAALGVVAQTWYYRLKTSTQARAQREIRALNAKLQVVLQTATNGIVALTPEKRVVSMNAAARHMLGGISTPTPFDWPDEIQFLERDGLQPLHSSADPIARILAGQTLRGETNVMTRATSPAHRYLRISSACVDDVHSPVAAVLVFDDVSKDELNRQQIDRSRRLDALGQLTGGIAHDFNNLLATMQYSIELALAQPAQAKPTRYLETALGAVRRGAELTARLLAFARQQPQLAKSRLVGDVLSDLRALVRPTIEETIEVRAEVKDAELWVFCDQGQLENALLNLVLNSRDAIVRSSVGETITIRARGVAEISSDPTLRREDPESYVGAGVDLDHESDRERADGRAYRYVELSVTDDGPGMTEEVKRRAVDPFFSTKDELAGTGLGLSMVYGFVQQSAGELRIYSEAGHGTTVRLLLPRGTPSGAREAPIERLPRQSGAGERILLVEDEASLLRLVDDLVKSLGYRTATACSGRDALDQVEGGLEFDLLLTDIVMPGGVGGFDLARQLRARRPDLPVIYMSGYTGFTAEEMGGVVAPLLAKPCPPAELADAIKTALHGDAQPRPQAAADTGPA